MPLAIGAIIVLGLALAFGRSEPGYPSVPTTLPGPPHPPGSSSAWYAGVWQWGTTTGWLLVDSRSGTGQPASQSAASTWGQLFTKPAPPYLYAAVFVASPNGPWQVLTETANHRADGSAWYVSAG